MSIKFGSIDKILPNITSDMFNNIGKHNNFALILSTDNRYPGKGDPIILRFDANVNKWIYVADKKIVDFGHLLETTIIENDYLALSKIPLDGVLWDIFIYKDKKIVTILKENDLKLRNNIVTGLEEYIGMTIEVRYCFGRHTEEIAPVQVNKPVVTTYETDVTAYVDVPRSDMNDIDGPKYYDGEITKDNTLPNSKTNMSLARISQEFDTYAKLLAVVESRRIYTTERLLIYENRAVLPLEAIGDIVNNMAIVYDGIGKEYTTIMDVTCSTDGIYVLFDSEDNLDNKYCVVSYLASVNE